MKKSINMREIRNLQQVLAGQKVCAAGKTVTKFIDRLP